MRGLSLVIPNHNGARVIEESIRKYHEIFSKEFDNFEMIVVCNGCTDESAEICGKLELIYPLKRVVISQKGKGYALIRGFDEAHFDYVGFLDADNPFDLDKILDMLKALEGNDLVLATKYKRGSIRVQDSLMRRLLSLGGGIFSRFFFNLKFADTQAGAKFFKREVWEVVRRRQFICTGFDFDIELLYKASRKNFKILEYYLPLVRFEKFTTVRLKYLLGMVFRLLKLRLR